MARRALWCREGAQQYPTVIPIRKINSTAQAHFASAFECAYFLQNLQIETESQNAATYSSVESANPRTAGAL